MKKFYLSIIVLVIASLGCSLLSPVDKSSDEPTQQLVDNSSAEPTQQPTVNFQSNVLFSDDFSDTDSGWDRVSDDIKVTDYYNGGYRMWTSETDYDVWANPYKFYSGAVRVEVDATKIGGPDDNDFGIICNYQDDDSNFYVGLISSDGYAVIAKLEDQSWSYISSESMEPVNGINLGSATNHIRFDCVQGSLTLYVNGNQVASAYDDTFTSGDVGLQVGNFDTGGVDILFDNFVVKEP